MLAAASLVSMPPGVSGEPAAEGLPTEEAVEEACAAADEATAEACAAADEATAEALPAQEQEEEPPLPSAEKSAVGAAGVDDSFGANTSDVCGLATFIDYGPGNPGGGNNDDYIFIQDICEDHHGVKAYAWRNGEYLGSKYLGKGQGSYVRWDPFPAGNVRPKDCVGLTVCLVDGSGDPTPFFCGSRTRCSQDG
jgi:hypothetical protein